MAVQLEATDFQRLCRLLAAEDQFRAVGSRIDFIDEAFQDSLRHDAIVQHFNAEGSAQAAAVRLVDWLCRFGPDAPERESLARVVDQLLMVKGAGADRDFLRRLIVDYRLRPHVGAQRRSDPQSNDGQPS